MAGWEIDAKAFSASLDAMIARLDEATRLAAVDGAGTIVRSARLRFAGQHPRGTPRTSSSNRPQSITENLRNSIHMLEPPMPLGKGIWKTRIAPTTPYGRRIELGFTGTDSLGRHFPGINPPGKGDPPYAYLRPGVARAVPVLQETFRYYWDTALAGA
jgi:hypothetical protein